MNLKKFLGLFLVLAFITINGFSQEQTESSQTFTTTRGYGKEKLEFKEIGAITQKEIFIPNKSDTDLEVTEVVIPEGVTITLVNKIIPAGKTGKIIVTLDPKYITSDLSADLIITTRQVHKMNFTVKVEQRPITITATLRK